MTTMSSDWPSTSLDYPAQMERFQKGSKKDLLRISTWALSQFDSIKTSRAAIERQWYLNLAFYFGRQNVIYRQGPNMIQGATGNLYVPPAPYWRSRPVINRIRPIIRKQITKLTSQKPNVYVVPATNDDRDLFAAQAGEQIWDSIYRGKHIGRKIRRALFWNQVCGTSFIKNYWDPDKIDEFAQQMGDMCIDPLTPFHLFAPDFREEEIEGQPFLAHAQMHTMDELKIKYPDLKLNKSERTNSDILDDTWINLVGANSQTDKKSIMALEVWIKKGAVSLFPEGAMFTVIGDQVVSGMEGWPYQHSMFPFAKLDHIPAGKFYSDSDIVDLVPLQREYNRTRGQVIEAKNRMAKPQLMAPRGSVDPAKITTEPGQVILYNPGLAPPQPLPLQSVPSYVLQELDRIILDMSDLSGQHEVSRGQTPAGVTAATAISYLQEQDDSILSHTYDSLEEAIEKVAHMTLSYVQQFWDYPRMVRVAGQDSAFDVLTLKGSDLRGNNDVRVEAGSSLPTSKAARMAWIMDLMKMGFIPPEKGLEVMEMGGISKIYESIRVDVRQAQRENTKMAAATQETIEMFQTGLQQEMEMNPAKYFDLATGEPKTLIGVDGMPVFPLLVPVNQWDNHPAHVEEHNNYRKSAAYEQLDDVQKGLFEEHVRQHVEQIVLGSMAGPPMMGPEEQGTMEQQPPMGPPEQEAPGFGGE